MYIVYRKYNVNPLRSELFQNVSLQSFTLEEGTLLDESKLFIFYNKDPIAKKDDLSIYEYLVNNDDNQGLEKGKYIYATAFAKRKRIHSNGSLNRFSENEIEVLTKFWNSYFDGKNFTLKYFNAEIEDLEAFAKAVNIKIDMNYVYKEDPDDIFEEHQYFVTTKDKPQFTLDANENENIIFQTGE